MKHATRVAAAATVMALLTACSGEDSPTGTSTPEAVSSPTTSSAGESSAAPSTSATPSPTATATQAPASGVPTDAELAKARADVSKLPTEKLAGQVIVGFYSGTGANAAASAIRKNHLGGVIVFDNNVPKDSGQVVSTIRASSAAAQQAMRDDGRDWPAIISVDQEGGPVARLGPPFTELPAGMAYGAAHDPALATKVAQAAGQELRALGMTMVFAPDADVTIGGQDPTIGVRSPGSDPQLVAQTAAAQAKGYTQAGVIPVVKHFPGHGSVTTDSHVGLPVQKSSVAELKKRDLLPFQQLVSSGAPAVMSAHVVLSELDPNAPTTMSHAVTTGLLRDQLGFKGLVVTDALQMGAVSERYGPARGAVQALKAGADVLLMPADPGASVKAITAAVGSGELSRDRLITSAARIVATMRRSTTQQPPANVVGNHQDEALALARASVTQVSGACGKRLVGEGVNVSGGTAADRSRFNAAAERAGLKTGSGTNVGLIGGGAYNAGSGKDTGSSGGQGQVLISLDTPYALAGGAPNATRIAAFGRTPQTFDAVAEVLAGKRKATGKLPVAVGSWKIGAGC